MLGTRREVWEGFVYNLIHYKTSRQSVICLSTAETELLGCSWASRLGLGFRNVIGEVLGFVEEERKRIKVTIVNDNNAAVQIASMQADIRKVRHMKIAHLFVRQAVESENVDVEYQRGLEMPADMLTKVVHESRLKDLSKMVGVWDDEEREPSREEQEKCDERVVEAMLMLDELGSF